jgi:hypothetical protein
VPAPEDSAVKQSVIATSPATQQMWAITARDALRDEGASKPPPNERRWRLLATSGDDGDTLPLFGSGT